MNERENTEATILNLVQQHLLKFFAFDDSEKKLLGMKAVSMKYFPQKLGKHLDELRDSRSFNQEELDKLRTIHSRTDLNDE